MFLGALMSLSIIYLAWPNQRNWSQYAVQFLLSNSPDFNVGSFFSSRYTFCHVMLPASCGWMSTATVQHCIITLIHKKWQYICDHNSGKTCLMFGRPFVEWNRMKKSLQMYGGWKWIVIYLRWECEHKQWAMLLLFCLLFCTDIRVFTIYCLL